jgi:putative ABC transport system permease protein
MLPLSYSIRNLGRSIWKTIQLVFAAAIVVFLVCAASSVGRGLSKCLSETGDPANVILLGAGSEESIQRSEIARSAPEIAASSVAQIKKVFEKPAVSPEAYYMGPASLKGEAPRQGLFRGVTWNALNVHRDVVLVAGRFPNPGEAMVGRQTARHLGVSRRELGIGDEIKLDKHALRIVGEFDANGTVMDAEIWMDLNELLSITKRETLSCAMLAMSDPEDISAATLFASRRLDLELTAIRETDYYAALSAFYTPVKYMVWLCALLVSGSAFFGGVNTLFAAMALRRKEFATLRVIGYGPVSLFLSLLTEAFIVNLAGGLLALALSALFMPEISISFSTGIFYPVFDNITVLLGLLTTLVLSLVGIILPAKECLGHDILSSLRSV